MLQGSFSVTLIVTPYIPNQRVPKCRVWKGTGSQVDLILNKEATADSGFYRGL